MYGECRVYDPSGNLKRVHSPKELMKRADDEFNTLNTRLSNPRSIKPKAPRKSKAKDPLTSKCCICRKEFSHIDPKANACSEACKVTRRAKYGKKIYEKIKAGTHIPKRRGPNL